MANRLLIAALPLGYLGSPSRFEVPPVTRLPRTDAARSAILTGMLLILLAFGIGWVLLR